MHFHFLFKAKLSTASLNNLYLLAIFFCEIATFTSKLSHLTFLFFIAQLLKPLIVAYGARMHGSVFKIIFLFFAGEFDSI